MNLILFGPPGSGKGTQARFIEKRLGFRHLSTGELLREAIQKKDSVGLRAKEYVDQGKLVPDSLIGFVVKRRLKEIQSEGAQFLFDGFPRTLEQIRQLQSILDDLSIGDFKVISLEVSDEEVIKRLNGRLSCPRCKSDYNLQYKKPQSPGVCDKCGESLERRSDDAPETVIERLKAYHQQTRPALDYFDKNSLLIRIPGEQDEETVFQAIRKALKG